MGEDLRCGVCKANASLHDVVDFNRSCEEARGKFLELAGQPVYYARCDACGFCFAPELCKWSLDEFKKKIYNDDYVQVDPDYLDSRPRGNAAALISMFGDRAQSIKHLDYGGGCGLMSRLLREANWQSMSYDPFVNGDVRLQDLGQFDLITAYEVFEHVPDVHALMTDLRALLAPQGLLLFSTLLSDGNIHRNQRLTWCYAAPRNGHISLFSRRSLALLAQANQVNFGSFNEGFHAFFAQVPPWAQHIIRVGQ